MPTTKTKEEKPGIFSFINKQTVITTVAVALVMSVISVFTTNINQSVNSYLKAPEEIKVIKKDLEDIKGDVKSLKESMNGNSEATNKILVEIIKKMDKITQE